MVLDIQQRLANTEVVDLDTYCSDKRYFLWLTNNSYFIPCNSRTATKNNDALVLN